MSGTSLDGLDIAACEFTYYNKVWNFNVLAAETLNYNDEWINVLKNIHSYNAYELSKYNVTYGKYIGESIKRFIEKYNICPLLIASHGHTVFHNPDENTTLQIGSGASISTASGCRVVCDFRTVDVALGGQGAPLVPVGEAALFHNINAFLNIGGFSNISFHRNKNIEAYDVCPSNIMLNYLASFINLAFDNEGKIASSGSVIEELFSQLNNIPYYNMCPPKSLGREWFEKYIVPLLNTDKYAINDLLRTATEHIAYQIFECFKSKNENKILITGGGALNSFLISRLKYYIGDAAVLPDKLTIEFKEAIIFGFLGLLRWLNKDNTLASVTGASRNSVGGCIYDAKVSSL